MILCCGEALIDFMPVETASGDLAFQPFNGGSIYNVAIALGRLGENVGFFGGLSNDFFGQMLTMELSNSQVDTALCTASERATTLAFVKLDNGQPAYVFLDEGSAGRMLDVEHIPVLPNAVEVLHFGSISLIHDPAAKMLEQMAKDEKGRRLVSIDPNIRPSLINDGETYHTRLERLFKMADIIKISDEDLEWMYPGLPHDSFAEQVLGESATLVVITKGKYGATAYTKNEKLNQSIEDTTVIDTVGAGDTFMAGLLASLQNQQLLSVKNLAKIDQPALKNALSYATRAAAVTVSRKGANPPWNDEL